MKTFNKTLLAALVASASTGALAAGEKIDVFTSGSLDGCKDDGTYYCASVAAEGVALGNDVITHEGIDFAIDNTVTGMNEINRILIEVEGAQFTLDADTVFGDQTSGNLMADSAAVGAYTPQLQSLSAMAIDFDAAAGEDFSANNAINIRNLKLDLDGAGLGDTVKVTVKAQKVLGTSNWTTVSQATGTVAEVVSQLGLATQYGAFVGGSFETINATNRLSFVGNNLETSADITISDRSVNYASVEAASGGEYSVLVEGDFGFLDADGDGEIDSGNTVSADGEVEFAEDFQSFVVKNDASGIDGAGDVTETIDFEFDGEREIPELDALATVSFGYQTQLASGTAITGGEFTEASYATSWSLEGVTTTFSYMPYFDNIDQILMVTNNGNNDAAITVTARDKSGNKYGPVKLPVVATAKGVTKITGQVKEALKDEGFEEGSVKLSITVNSSSVDVYGAYNVDGNDRGYVPAQ